MVIVINKDKSMLINTEPTDENRLGPRLEDIFKTRAERVVFVKGDPDLEFQFVARAIDIAKGAGIDKIGLMTAKSGGRPVSRPGFTQAQRIDLLGASMNRKTTSLLLVVAVVMLVIVGAGCQKLRARDQLNKGVQAFRNGSYPAAVENFKVAVSLDPQFPTARLYLAMAYMMQYIPGAESPENTRMSQAAHDEFMKVLEQDPKNSLALAYLAKLFFDQKKLDRGR